MQSQLPTPVITVVIVVIVLIVGFLGWRYVNPPDLQPVGAQGATAQPMVVPGQNGPAKGPGKPGPAAPTQPQ